MHPLGTEMNWQEAYRCVQVISGSNPDAPRAVVQLRHEVIASIQLTPDDKSEIHGALDALQNADMYQKVALVGQLIEVLSLHSEFEAKLLGGKRKPG